MVMAAGPVPYPVDSKWKERMYHMLRILSDMGKVDLVCYEEEGGQASERDREKMRGADSVSFLAGELGTARSAL
jgi:hypothetical protein